MTNYHPTHLRNDRALCSLTPVWVLRGLAYSLENEEVSSESNWSVAMSKDRYTLIISPNDQPMLTVPSGSE